LLAKLQAEQTNSSSSVREFVKILKLHETYPVNLIEQAVTQALTYGCIHADGVALCLRQLMHPETAVASLDLAGNTRLDSQLEPLDLQCYERLLVGGR
jgi:hypothetical protein